MNPNDFMTKDQKRFMIENKDLLSESCINEIERLRHLKEGRDPVESRIRNLLILVTLKKNLFSSYYFLIPKVDLGYFSWQTFKFLEITIAKKNPIKNPLKISFMIRHPDVDIYTDRLGFLHSLKGPALESITNEISSDLFFYHGALIKEKELWKKFPEKVRLKHLGNWYHGESIRESLL